MKEFNPDFWRGLNPSMALESATGAAQRSPLRVSGEAIKAAVSLLQEEGYAQFPPPPWNVNIGEMAHVVSKLAANNYPPPFAFVYDEFWALFAQLNPFIAGVLGDDFRQLPDFWAWRVDGARSEAGWRPHRDKGYRALFPDRSPISLTVWIPLTDADPLNGCMYLVPADRDPTYGTPNDNRHEFAMPDVRALPAVAGSVLCWNQAVLHWGAHASPRAASPRISVAFEFQTPRASAFNTPLLDPHRPPDFVSRMWLIAKQILQYKHMYPLAGDIEQLANAILRERDTA